MALCVNAQRNDNYQPLNPNVDFQSSELPVVTISTGNQTIDRQETIAANVVVSPGIDNRIHSFDGKAQLSYYGAEIFTHQAKKSFHLTTTDGTEWLLMAFYSDRSLMRAQLTNTLARQFIPTLPVSGHCEVVVDGVYYGLYQIIQSSLSFEADMADYLIAAEVAHDADSYRFNIEGEDKDSQSLTVALLNTYLGYGNNYADEGYRTDTWIYKENSLLQAQDDPWWIPAVWTELTSDGDFKSLLRERWTNLRASTYNDEHIEAVIDSMATLLKSCGALDRDSQAWPVWGRRVWPNHYTVQSFDEEVAAMKEWLSERLAWIDTNINAAEVIVNREPLTVKSGFNADVVVEATPASTHVNADLDDNNFVFYSAAYRSDGGLPADGAFHSDDSDVDYQLADYTKNNVLRLGSKGATGTLTLSSPTTMSQLFIVAMGGNGSGSYTITVNYADGTTTRQSMEVSDWGYGGGVLSMYRMLSTNGSVSTSHDWSLYEDSIAVDNTKSVVSLTFTSTSDPSWEGYQPIVSIFALSAMTEKVVNNIMPTTLDPFVVERTEYYDTSGRRLIRPKHGLNIIVEYGGNQQVRRRIVTL